MRGVEYELTIENLKAYPDYVFFVYPTTNSGYAYRFEEGKGLTSLMVNGNHGMTSELFAVSRAAFEKAVPKPEAYPHGDKEAMVQVFVPVKGAQKANVPIAPPDPVPGTSPIRKVERVLRITKLTGDTFELAVVRHEALMNDGTRSPIPVATQPARATAAASEASPRSSAPTSPSAAPESKRAGCSGCSATGGSQGNGILPLLAIATLVGALRRRRTG